MKYCINQVLRRFLAFGSWAVLFSLLLLSGTASAGTATYGSVTGSISGMVRDQSSGRGIFGLSVKARLADDFVVEAVDPTTVQVAGRGRIILSQQQTYIAKSNNNGLFTLERMPAGAYRIWLETDGSGYVGQYYDGALLPQSARPVEVQAGQSRAAIDFNLTFGGSIKGRLLDQEGKPLAGLRVKAMPTDASSIGGQAASGTDGVFVVNGLAAGQYTIEADGGDHFVSIYYGESGQRQNAQPVTITENAEVPLGDLSLPRNASISGRIFEASTSPPTPLPAIRVAVYPVVDGSIGTTPAAQTVSASDGAYLLSGLLPGTYELEAQPSSVYCQQKWPSGTLTVPAGGALTDIDFSLLRGGRINGKAVDQDGRPLVGARISAISSQFGVEHAFAATDDSGAFSIGQLVPGAYRLRAHAANHRDVFFSQSGDETSAVVLPLDSGGVLENIDFQLARLDGLPEGSIGGTVFAHGENRPLANICVYAYGVTNEEIYGYGCSDTAGRYRLTALPDGEYKICAKPKQTWNAACYGDVNLSGTGTTSELVQVKDAKQVASIDFALQQMARITGTLFRSVDRLPIGTYRIDALRPGSYLIRLQPGSTGYQQIYYGNVTSAEKSLAVQAEAGAEKNAVDLHISFMGS